MTTMTVVVTFYLLKEVEKGFVGGGATAQIEVL
jgi:hypothetical protein